MADWYAVYKTDTGELVSTGTSVGSPEELAERGFASVVLDAAPGDRVWNPTNLDFDPAPPPRAQTLLTRVRFMLLFTLQERLALRASEDPVVSDFRWLVDNAEEIDLTEINTQMGTQYLVSIGILTPERAATLLSGAAP